MTNAELIERLLEYPLELQVTIDNKTNDNTREVKSIRRVDCPPEVRIR